MPSNTIEHDLFLIIAHSGFPDKLEDYLKKNEDNKIDVFSKDGYTALIQCVQGSGINPSVSGTDHVACCRILLRRGANSNLVDKLGRTAIHWAIFYKNVELVKVLLEAKCDIFIEDKKGQNAVHFAVRMNAADCLKLICENIDGIDDSSNVKLKILSKSSSSVGTPLIYAVKLGHKECCEILLQAGSDIDVKDQTYFDKTSLHISTELNNTEIMEMLLKFDANDQAIDGQGNNICHVACTNSNLRALEIVLEKCRNVQRLIDTKNKEGQTPLMLASYRGFGKHVKLLLENNAPTNIQDDKGKTALHHAIGEGHRECAELLLAADAGLPWTQDLEGRSPLHLAVIEGKKEVVQMLVSNSGLNCKDNQGHTPIHWAVVCGYHDLIDTLVDHGGNPSLADDHGASPLHYAAQMCGDPNVSEIGILCVKTLLKRGAKVNAIDVGHKTPLLWASSAGSSEACRLLKEGGADVSMADLDGLTALHCAVMCSHADCVNTLVTECNCAVDTPDKKGCTPLFYAASVDQEDIIKILLDNGASPNYKDSSGKTPVHCAASSGSLDALRILHEKGGSLDQEDGEGESPFFAAIQQGDLDTIKYMVDNGCKPQCADKEGVTPLHISAKSGNLELCQYLIENDVDKNPVCFRENGLPMTPLDYAWDSGAVPCMEYLASVGAKRGRDLSPDQIGPKPLPTTSKKQTTPSKEEKGNSNKENSPLKKETASAKLEIESVTSSNKTPSEKDDAAKSSPYAEPLVLNYDYAQELNEAERQRAANEKTDPMGQKLADWQSYVKDNVQFLDDLLSVNHERLEAIQSHALKEREFLVQRLAEIKDEMERRMEKRVSEEEKRKEERRKQREEEKRAIEERFRQIQERYLGIDDSVSDKLNHYSKTEKEMDRRKIRLEKMIKKKKAELVQRREDMKRTDLKRTQKHQDWLKRKNKEYIKMKNAVKLKSPLVVDCGSLNVQMNRSMSPSGKNRSVAARVDHLHRTRSTSPPHSRQIEHQTLGQQRSPSPLIHGSRNSSSQSTVSSLSLPPATASGQIGRGRSMNKRPNTHPPTRQQRWRSEERGRGSAGELKGDEKMGGRRYGSEGLVDESGRDRTRGRSTGSATSTDSSRASSGPDSCSVTSHKLAQLRRSHGGDLNKKMFPKSWELQSERGSLSSEQETIYDLKRGFSPTWNGKMRPRHVLQFKSSGLNQRQEGKIEA